MRVLFADAVAPSAVEALTQLGHQCVAEPTLSDDALPGRMAGFEALVVRSTKVTAATIEAADVLELIVRAGAGINTIDVDAASDVGITSRTCRAATRCRGRADDGPPAGDRPADRGQRGRPADGHVEQEGVLEGGRSVREDVRHRRARRDRVRRGGAGGGVRPPGPGDREASRRGGRGADRAIGIELVDSLDTLVSTSDVVSIHVPATSETVGSFDARVLGLLRRRDPPEHVARRRGRRGRADGCGRAPGIRAGLDVYPDEPGSGATEWSSKLAQHPNVVGTHHIGASTEQAEAVADGVVAIIESYVHGEIVDCVNLAPSRLGTHTLHVRHLDRVGVLAGVFDVLRRRELNVEQMENRIFQGRNAAVATIDVVGEVGPLLAALGLEHVIHVSVVLTGQAGA